MLTFLCKKCGNADPAGFYEYQPGECKACVRARVLANRAKRVGYYRAFDRERSKDPRRKAQYVAKQRKKRKEMGPGYEHAHYAVSRALRLGLITKPKTCSRCPASSKIEAHHDDHSRPLDVMWLCPVCHAQRHKELGRLRTLDRMYGEQPDPLPPF